MKAATLHRWSAVHTWSSLLCTLFLLIICLTGLPLIFSAEIDRLGEGGAALESAAATTPAGGTADIDEVLSAARQAFPGDIIRSVYWPEGQPSIIVTLAPSDDAKDSLDHRMTFDLHSGLERKRDAAVPRTTFMDIMEHLHEDLFLELPGELFLGLMAVFFVIAIVSGIALYAPFMRHVAFDRRRAPWGSRLAWLDLHNVLSAVALIWMLVVGVTGVLNELATPLFVHWLGSDVNGHLATHRGEPLTDHPVAVSAVLREVHGALPNRKIETVDFPTHGFGSPKHYLAWTKGDTPLTSRIYIPAWVDAVDGKFAMAAPPPAYLLALEVSRPLHFGDYGGLPLKILWATFDMATILVLISGLKLWVSRRHRRARREELMAPARKATPMRKSTA